LNKAILNSEIQEYIRSKAHSDIIKISLSKSPFPGVSPKELAQQLDGRRRSENKLPLWYSTTGIYYPEKLALEQCSSEKTARYKSGLIVGNKVIDLTGGFGVDAVFFSQTANNVIHCELNKELSEISEHNAKVFGFEVNHYHGNGIEKLKQSDNFYDTIYIDPSRRVSSRKVFMLKDCEPDIISERELLFRRCKRLIIKTAPLLDLQSTIRELGSVTGIHILSIKNECKEVVYLVDEGTEESDPPITCASLNDELRSTFTFRASAENAFILNQYSKPMSYLYEPDVALLKAGCFKLITKEFNVIKLHQHTHLYTSANLQETFMGRKFKVLNTWDYGSFIKQGSFSKANIICRNFPQDPDKIRKKLRINDGGTDYLLFSTGPSNELLVIHCERI
jgi:hypothetical protein